MGKKPRDAKLPEPFTVSTEYLFTAVSAWLIPGAGHWLLGYRVRGAVLGAAILGLFWMGQFLAVPAPDPALVRKPLAVSRKISPVFFACQAGNGFSAILSSTLWGEPRQKDQIARIDRGLPPHLNLAILFTSVSGLLNYMLVLYILDPRVWRQAREDSAARPSTGEEAS